MSLTKHIIDHEKLGLDEEMRRLALKYAVPPTEDPGISQADADARYLMLDTSNDPLTGNLDMANNLIQNIGAAGTDFTAGGGLNIATDLDVNGHVAVGPSASVLTGSVFRIDEDFTQNTGTRYVMRIENELAPVGVLTGATVLQGRNQQTVWDSASDGSLLGYIYGDLLRTRTDGTATGALKELVGSYNRTRHWGTGTITDLYGYWQVLDNNDSYSESGHITNAYQFKADSATDKTTGTITNRYGLYISETTGGGNITNQYGIYCEALAVGGTTNLFIKNISADSDFGSGDITTTGIITVSTITAGAGNDLTVKLGDAVGVNKISFTDSGDVEVAYINSNGKASITGAGTDNLFISGGNETTAGTGKNIAIGLRAGDALTTGYQNMFLGIDAGTDCTIGYSNVCIGEGSGANLLGGHDNLMIGQSSGISATSAYNNIFIGDSSGHQNVDGHSNTCVGRNALRYGQHGYSNVLVGAGAGEDITNGNRNACVGGTCGANLTGGARNAFLGHDAGVVMTTGGYNVAVGNAAGRNNNGSYNVFLGREAGFNEAGSHKLYISNSNTATPLIYGEFDNVLLRFAGKVAFTQIDNNEYIDSLNDGYMDYGATTQHRFNNNVDITGNLMIDGAADAIQCLIQAHSTQNQNLLVIEDSAGNDYFIVDNVGNLWLTGNQLLSFRDSAIGIYSQADTFLDLYADGAVRIGDSSAGAPTNYASFASDGDLTFVGTAGLNFGSCGGYHMAWTQVAAQNTWYNVVDADFIDGQLNNVTHDGNGKLTVAKAGKYLCNISLDMEVDAANKHIEIGFEVNGSGSAATEGIVCTETKFANEEHCLGTTAILDLAASETLELCIRTIDAGNPTITVDCVSMNCTLIGGT